MSEKRKLLLGHTLVKHGLWELLNHAREGIEAIKRRKVIIHSNYSGQLETDLYSSFREESHTFLVNDHDILSCMVWLWAANE